MERTEMVDTLVDWYVIGLGDELIVNKIGGKMEVDIFHGRVSGFPKTSWVYHLKHIIYDAGRCVRYSLPFDGIWEDLKTKKCARSKITKGAEFPDQPHLMRLRELNLTFPQAWITTSGEIKVDVK